MKQQIIKPIFKVSVCIFIVLVNLFAGGKKADTLSPAELRQVRQETVKKLGELYEFTNNLINAYPRASLAFVLQDEGLTNLYGESIAGQVIESSALQFIGGATFCNWNETNVHTCTFVQETLNNLTAEATELNQQLLEIEQELAERSRS